MAVNTVPTAGWLRAEDCHLEDLLQVLDAGTDPAAYPHADRIEQGVVVYDAGTLQTAGLTDESAQDHSATDDSATDGARRGGARRELQTEIAHALADGPGIVVFSGAFDGAVVDRATAAFQAIIAEQRARGVTVGDHFAKPGANDRVWNALEKLAVLDPDTFVDYYANGVVALAATAWLGPGYQVTSQVNVVNPGGAGQTVHRDYHLGFQSPEVSAAYPAHVHALSPVLTLQGAVAHCDMPVESGPTLYLPHSQKYSHGYLAYWLPQFQEYFVDHHIQLPLAKGDAVFFNPALFHAAGSNHSGHILRMANLLQISSAFGRAMEAVDRARIVAAIYPALLSRKASGVSRADLDRAVAASAEGYAFPTNLDRDQPIGGMSPRTQADVVRQALADDVARDELVRRLDEQARSKLSH